MVYDCFQFFNELDILRLRLHVLDPVVDYFVLSESDETFSGRKKPLYYEENKDLFREFEHKIIHNVVTDTPEGGTHERDTFQKNAVTRGLKDASDDDVILFSDLDEIPDPRAIRRILDAGIAPDKVYHFAQRLFYCYLNMEEVSGKLLSYAGDFEDAEPKKWIGTKMLTYGLLREKGWQLGELRFPDKKALGIRVDDGGWHFGYMGGKGETDIRKRVEEKVVSAAHQEYNNKFTLDRVTGRILDGQDIFGRDATFVRREIDESYPEYLRTHQEEFAHLILKEEAEEEKQRRHREEARRDFAYRLSLPLRKIVGRLLGR